MGVSSYCTKSELAAVQHTAANLLNISTDLPMSSPRLAWTTGSFLAASRSREQSTTSSPGVVGRGIDLGMWDDHPVGLLQAVICIWLCLRASHFVWARSGRVYPSNCDIEHPVHGHTRGDPLLVTESGRTVTWGESSFVIPLETP